MRTSALYPLVGVCAPCALPNHAQCIQPSFSPFGGSFRTVHSSAAMGTERAFSHKCVGVLADGTTVWLIEIMQNALPIFPFYDKRHPFPVLCNWRILAALCTRLITSRSTNEIMIAAWADAFCSCLDCLVDINHFLHPPLSIRP